MVRIPSFRVPGLACAWPYAPPLLVGIILRLWGLSSQVPLDDEWHSLNFVLDKSFWAVLTTHGLGANCIPQNIINWLLLRTTGWSELALYLPSVLVAVLGLLAFPPLIMRLFGRPTALLFAWLLAIAPCVIFYSRIIRPYSMVLVFGFFALLQLALWSREGRPRQLAAYALAGFAAIYFHLYSALPVLAPLGVLFLLAVLRRTTLAASPWITARALAGAGAAMALLVAALLLPAHLKNPWWLGVQGVSRVSATGLWEFLSLLAGTRVTFAKLAFAALASYGLARTLKQDFRSGLVFLSAWAAFLVFAVLATQEGMSAGIQIARYNIVLFPVAILLVAIGLADLLARLPSSVPSSGRTALATLPIAVLAAGSPLWTTFALPNNFMHHSAFQDSYAPFDWSRSRLRALTPLPLMPRERIPALYSTVAATPSIPGIIEYPMFIGDPLNLHYFYQHFHRKPVAIGYVPNFPFPPLPSNNDFIYQTTPVDYVLNRSREHGWETRMRFRQLLPISDSTRLRQEYSGWLLVVHRDLLLETLGLRELSVNVIPPIWLEPVLTVGFGPPIFSDAQIVAWKIP